MGVVTANRQGDSGPFDLIPSKGKNRARDTWERTMCMCVCVVPLNTSEGVDRAQRRGKQLHKKKNISAFPTPPISNIP